MKVIDLPEIQQLSREEKLRLIADLWDHLSAQADDDLQPVSAEEAALLDQRLAAHKADPQRALSLEEFKRRLAARRCTLMASRSQFVYSPNCSMT